MFMQTPADDAAKEAERQELKVGMRQSAVQTKIKINGLEKEGRLEKEADRALAIEQQLNAPVADPVITPEDCHIGKWNGSLIGGETYEKSQDIFSGSRYDELPENQNDYLRGIIRQEKSNNDDRLAYYAPIFDEIFLQSHTAQPEDLPYDKEYANRNPLAENSIAYHEALHKRHANHNGMYDVSRPIANTFRTDRLTETTAHAVQYLSTAHAYTQLKNMGADTFEYTTGKDGEEKTVTMPLENALDMYPGLREAMDGKDFSPDDPKMVRKIVAASAQNWENNYKDAYYIQNLTNTAMIYGCQQNPAFSFRLRLARNQENPDKDFAKLSKEMLKDVYIGNNTAVNLTGCEDLLNTMSAEEAGKWETALKTISNAQHLDLDGKDMQAVNNWLEKNGITGAEEKDKYLEQAITDITNPQGQPSTAPELQALLAKAFINSSPEPSDEEVFAINEYLERKGLHTDEEKDKYMEKAFTDIVNRSPEADPELKKLLLGNSGSIKYTDGLVETPIPNTECSIVADKDGKTYNIGTLSHFSSRLEERRQSENTAEKEQNKTASFAPAQLHQLKERSGR